MSARRWFFLLALQPWIRLSVAAVGALVIAGAGWVLWRLEVRRRLWAALWLISAVVVLVLSLESYPSFERALPSTLDHLVFHRGRKLYG